MFPRVGAMEIVLSCVVGLIGIGLPVAIYNKVKAIEEMLKKEE